jgi:hypothetical protein
VLGRYQNLKTAGAEPVFYILNMTIKGGLLMKIRKLVKEPLVHFLILGALLFGLHAIVNDPGEPKEDNRIVISDAKVEWMKNAWSKKWNRPPTETELRGLVDSYIKEEVYYREALAMGLDKNDTVLRRRLMQKMEFLSNDLAELNTPNEAELNKYFLDNQEKYELPARVSFTHIYFSLDKRGAKVFDDAKSVLAGLNALRAPEKGDSFMLQYDFVQETPYEVERLFGKGFAEKIFTLETNTWHGPIESGYGLHLVRLSEKIDARMPQLAAVIEKVRTDLMFEQRQKMNKEIYDRFKERYEIVVEERQRESGVAEATQTDKERS